MDAIIILALKEIQLECYKQIAIEQRGGRAIPEEPIAPYPNEADYSANIMLENYTLDQLVADTQKEDPQIDIEEAIHTASAQQQTSSAQEDVQEPRRRGGKIKAYFDAIRDWHYDKREKEYEYQCSKQQTYDRTYGFEYIAKYIDTFLKKWEKDEGDTSKPTI